jgi:hypothetical protein
MCSGDGLQIWMIAVNKFKKSVAENRQGVILQLWMNGVIPFHSIKKTSIDIHRNEQSNLGYLLQKPFWTSTELITDEAKANKI